MFLFHLDFTGSVLSSCWPCVGGIFSVFFMNYVRMNVGECDLANWICCSTEKICKQRIGPGSSFLLQSVEACTWLKMFRMPTSLGISWSCLLAPGMLPGKVTLKMRSKGISWHIWVWFQGYLHEDCNLQSLDQSLNSLHFTHANHVCQYQTVRCMACSDNVVRGGLTPKFKETQP